MKIDAAVGEKIKMVRQADLKTFDGTVVAVNEKKMEVTVHLGQFKCDYLVTDKGYWSNGTFWDMKRKESTT